MKGKEYMKKKINLRRIGIIIITLIIVITLGLMGVNYFNSQQKTNTIENNQIVNEQILDTNIITSENITIQEQEQENEKVEEVTPAPETAPVKEIFTELYTTTGLNIRKGPGTEYEVIDTVSINTLLKTVDGTEENGWIKIKSNDNYYYVANKYLSKEKTVIKTTVTSRGTDLVSQRVNNTQKSSSGNVLTKSKGVNYFNGHRETWYSQKVLPGGGLKIPGRHVNNQELVCDGDGYICVASSDYSKGTIVETSLGTGKVYDCGCASGTIDIYCDW